MVSVKDFLEACDYQISDCFENQWDCFPDKALSLGCDFGHATAEITFSSKNQTVYEINVMSNSDDHYGYRWISPDVLVQYENEYEIRGLDFKECYDDVRWADTDCSTDILEKINAIRQGLPFDRRVVMYVEVDDDLYSTINHAANLLGVTVEDFMVMAIEEAIEADDKKNNKEESQG